MLLRKRKKRSPLQRESNIKVGCGRINEAIAISQAFGVFVRISPVSTKAGVQGTWHCMFEDESGNRLLDWWPTGKGTWWCAKSGERGRTLDAEEAVQLAHSAMLVA